MNIKKYNEIVKKFNEYIFETYKNKIVAIVLFACSLISIKIENDLTAFLLIAPLSIYLFFSKKNWIIGF